MTIWRFCGSIGVVALLLPAALAQRTLDHDRSVVSQVRIDLRDLGYPPIDVIPSDESAVRALAVGPDGSIYGATSGKRSQLFVLDPMHGYVQPLGFLKGVSTVHRALVVSRSGDVYIGASIGVDNNGEGYAKYAGGSLLKYTPSGNQYARPIRLDVAVEVTDLGVPVAGEGIYSLALDRVHEIVYGITYPNGHFFRYYIRDGRFENLGKLAEKPPPGEKFELDKSFSRAIAIDRKGNVFVSGEGGAIYRYDNRSLEKTGLFAPTVKGREAYNRVDAWTECPEGHLYGGTSDGYLFHFNPESLSIDNLGKPLNQYRIRGLVFAPNGKIYGVGGDDDEMARLFSYEPGRGTYEMLGFVDVNRRPHYTWQAYKIDSMALGLDGTVYMGQAERISKLYLYHPEVSPRAHKSAHEH